MRLSFENDLAVFLLLGFVLIAIAGSMLVYYKNRKISELSVLQTRILSIIRATGIFLCLLLLLKPVIISRKQIKEKPVIVVAADNSESLSQSEKQMQDAIAYIGQNLGKKYTVEHWSFGEKAIIRDTLNFTDTKSNYSDILSSVSNQYINKNIGALIMLGDGIYNTGQNPLNQLSKLNFPVYTVGFGDTVRVPDIRITKVRHNQSVFINNYFSIEADIQFDKFNNQTARIEVIYNHNVVDSKTIAIPTNNYFISETFRIQAVQKGLQNYSVRVVSGTEEQNIANNSHDFAIEVIDTKHKVLIVSDGPNPDIGAIKTTLESYSNFEITLLNGNVLSEKPEAFDMFVLYQLPSAQNPNSQLIQNILKSGKPLFFILGTKTSLPYLNNLQLGISSSNGNGLIESQFSFNKDFNLFKMENENAENIESFPPLYVPYSSFTTSGELQVLGFQKIKGIATSNPLIVLGELENQKIAYLLGEGIWRWRIHDFSINHNYETINDFIYKIFNYLVLKENNENFKLQYSPVYSENEEVTISAELYNDSYEPINTPDVSLVLNKDSVSEFTFTFDKVDNKYMLNLGKPEAGNYRMEASVTLGTSEYRKTGNFMVVSLNIEKQQTVANHQLLYQLAYESGGKFYMPEKMNQLADEILLNEKIKPDKFVHFAQNELLNLKWIFMILVFMFGLEWFLRKYWGTY